MAFIPKHKKAKANARYKTLYLTDDLINKVDEISTTNGTSFNNVVVSMIKQCLDENDYTDLKNAAPDRAD